MVREVAIEASALLSTACRAVGNPLPGKELPDQENLGATHNMPAPARGMKRKSANLFDENEDASRSESKAPRNLESDSGVVTHSALDDLSDNSLDIPMLMPLMSPSPDPVVHVSQSGLLDLRQKLTEGTTIEQEDVRKVLHRRQSMTVPIDVRLAGSPFLDLPEPTDLDDVCEKLGAHSMAEGLVKALQYDASTEEWQ